MSLYRIYTLEVNGLVFYVGMTKVKLKSRLSVHRAESKGGGSNSRKDEIISENFYNVKIKCLEQIRGSKEKAAYMEVYWIQQFQAWGFVLCNKCGVCRRKSEWVAPKKKNIQIGEQEFFEFRDFCKQRGMIMNKVAERALREKMDAILAREERLKVA